MRRKVQLYIAGQRVDLGDDSWILYNWVREDLKPFDCATCMTWWTCLAYALIQHDLTLWTVAASAALSLLSIPITDLLLFIREGLSAILRKLFDKL